MPRSDQRKLCARPLGCTYINSNGVVNWFYSSARVAWPFDYSRTIPLPMAPFIRWPARAQSRRFPSRKTTARLIVFHSLMAPVSVHQVECFRIRAKGRRESAPLFKTHKKARITTRAIKTSCNRHRWGHCFDEYIPSALDSEKKCEIPRFLLSWIFSFPMYKHLSFLLLLLF